MSGQEAEGNDEPQKVKTKRLTTAERFSSTFKFTCRGANSSELVLLETTCKARLTPPGQVERIVRRFSRDDVEARVEAPECPSAESRLVFPQVDQLALKYASNFRKGLGVNLGLNAMTSLPRDQIDRFFLPFVFFDGAAKAGRLTFFHSQNSPSHLWESRCSIGHFVPLCSQTRSGLVHLVNLVCHH